MTETHRFFATPDADSPASAAVNKGYVDDGGVGSIYRIAGAYVNTGNARQLINLWENTETTSLNAIQTGGWVPLIGTWRVSLFEISMANASPVPGLTVFELWKGVSPYNVNVVSQASWQYTPAGGAVVAIDTVNDVPASGSNPTYSFDNPCDIFAFSIDPTGDHGSVRWRLTLQKAS